MTYLTNKIDDPLRQPDGTSRLNATIDMEDLSLERPMGRRRISLCLCRSTFLRLDPLKVSRRQALETGGDRLPDEVFCLRNLPRNRYLHLKLATSKIQGGNQFQSTFRRIRCYFCFVFCQLVVPGDSEIGAAQGNMFGDIYRGQKYERGMVVLDQRDVVASFSGKPDV